MQVNREDVVQAALMLERWCKEQSCGNCPFGFYKAWRLGCAVSMKGDPKTWHLEEFLRTRGLKDV